MFELVIPNSSYRVSKLVDKFFQQDWHINAEHSWAGAPILLAVAACLWYYTAVKLTLLLN